MKIDGQDYTLLRDYDKGKYQYLTFEGKVEYLRARVELILLSPCRSAMSAAAVENGGMGLVLTTAICAMISAAGTFLKGKRAPPRQDESFFLDFVHQYMHVDLQQEVPNHNMTWVGWLYRDVRCGLAHAFAIETGGIEISQKYLEVKPYGPEICPKQLLEDFASGWTRYLSRVLSDGPGNGLGELFERRFDQIFHD